MKASKINNIQINSFTNKSVWEDRAKLDAIFVNINSALQIVQKKHSVKVKVV